MSDYTVQIGLDYPTAQGNRRAEPGDVVSDLPVSSVPWLLADGAISADPAPPAPEVPAPAAEPAPAEVVDAARVVAPPDPQIPAQAISPTPPAETLAAAEAEVDAAAQHLAAAQAEVPA